jgi:hypothetical protein
MADAQLNLDSRNPGIKSGAILLNSTSEFLQSYLSDKTRRYDSSRWSVVKCDAFTQCRVEMI